jgi:hypothetical protein
MPVLPEHFQYNTFVDIYMPETIYERWSWGVLRVWDWCEKNCKGRFDSAFDTKVNGYKTWMFELPEDATAFKLVWQR